MSGELVFTKWATLGPAFALHLVIVGAGSKVWLNFNARIATPIKTSTHPVRRLAFTGLPPCSPKSPRSKSFSYSILGRGQREVCLRLPIGRSFARPSTSRSHQIGRAHV